mmetsp:Transcript_28482/g.53388  ORF Transcript_28482/g.53388 Transcript_28482/m.53388 type:complete len:277 (-) Transcript_28482:5399-6229(-)
MDPDDGIGPHLGHDGKKGCDWGGRFGVTRRQPEVQRDQCRLDRKDQQKQDRRHADADCRLWPNQLDAVRQIRHVQRPRLRIDRAKREKEQGRADQVKEHILHPRPQPRIAPRMDHQTIGGDQQHFEENKQVKEVARQKRPHDPHQLELEQRMEMPPPVVPARANGIKQHKERQHRRQQNHHGRQPVAHQNDAKGGRPIAQLIEQDGAVRGLHSQPGGHSDQRQNASHRKHPLDADVIARRQHDEWGQQCGQNNGGNDPMGHDRPSVWASSPGWSST